MHEADVRSAQVVVPCTQLAETLSFFTDQLGFRIERITPADDPEVAVISGYGVRLRLERGGGGGGGGGAAGTLRLECRDPGAIADSRELIAPNGTRVELVLANAPLVMPPLVPSFVLSRASGATWVEGRAGMRYRDLVPDRQGGCFIASHIQIPEGGPVPDYVHHHAVRFQMIYCHAGWVRVAYEDQGPPLTMQEGDCVVQPPGIRHRVLESSPGLEVIEIGAPARHNTFADHSMSLPTDTLDPKRTFEGQRFVHHIAARATWQPSADGRFEHRDTGIADATDGVADVRVARPSEGAVEAELAAHDAALCFRFVLRGGVSLRLQGRDEERLGRGDAFAVPAGQAHALSDPSEDLRVLEVTVPIA